jgi:hypothetical protein
MRANIFERTTTTTTTVAPTAGYGQFEQNTNRMTESADARLAFGFKYKAKRVDQNVVGGAFFKSTQGATCTVYFKNGSSANGTSVELGNLPSLAPNVKAPSESNGMACKTTNQGNFFFYNKAQKDFLTELRGYSQETEEKTSKLETQLNAEETEALKYFTTQLGGPLIKDPVQANQIYSTISNFIQMSGQSVYFGYLKSAINAQMKILNRKRADNQKLGKTLSSTEEDLWANYKKLNDAIPEVSTVNPTGYDPDDLASKFDEVPLIGYPFDNLTPAKGIPLMVYVPLGATTGAAFGRKSLESLTSSNEEESLTTGDCILSFQELACYMRPFNDKRFVKACPAKFKARVYKPENALKVKAVKNNVAACLTSGLYEVNRDNVSAIKASDSGMTRSYLRMINNDFFSPDGAFNSSAIPCAFINISAPVNGQTVDGCNPKTTRQKLTQKESYTFKNNVHKLLTEAKDRKKKEILENDIIETKFVGILESIERPTRRNINQSVNQILSETKRYMSKKYDREIIQENLGNVYKFITAMVGDEDDIKEMFVKKTLDEILVKKLGMDASDPMTIHIIDEVSSKIDANSIPDMITDCHYLAVQIAEAIPTAYANKLTSDSNNGFLSQFQNVITGKLQDGDTSKKLISMLSGPVCETLNGIQSKMDEKLKGFKQNLFQKD